MAYGLIILRRRWVLNWLRDPTQSMRKVKECGNDALTSAIFFWLSPFALLMLPAPPRPYILPSCQIAPGTCKRLKGYVLHGVDRGSGWAGRTLVQPIIVLWGNKACPGDQWVQTMWGTRPTRFVTIDNFKAWQQIGNEAGGAHTKQVFE